MTKILTMFRSRKELREFKQYDYDFVDPDLVGRAVKDNSKAIADNLMKHNSLLRRMKEAASGGGDIVLLKPKPDFSM